MDPESNGFGQTIEEVRAMPEIPLTDLMAYFDAVRTVTRRYLDQATDGSTNTLAGERSRGPGLWGTSSPRRVNTRARWR
jgi:hypothetical protein